MSTNVPYSFIPGTKARAQEVNANFNYLSTVLDEKVNTDFSNVSEKGLKVIKESISTKNLGEIVFSSFPLTDAGLHLLDGSLIRNEGMYTEFVSYISRLYDKYPNIFLSQSEWDLTVEEYGECGKFVYNSENKSVRLPKINGIIEGTTDSSILGDLIKAGLPAHTHTRGSMNITGTIYGSSDSITQTWGEGIGDRTGAFSSSTVMNGKSISDGNGTNTKLVNLVFNAANSWTGSTSTPDYSTEVEVTTTVQPQTIKAFVYIVIATSSKTDIQVDIDNIATDLNGKADKEELDNKAGTDLTNITNTGKVLMSGMGMPSAKYVDLSLGANGASYTAPANGWFVIHTDNICCFRFYNKTKDYGLTSYSKSGFAGDNTLIVNKGDVVIITYEGATSSNRLRFIYAKGSESDAMN